MPQDIDSRTDHPKDPQTSSTDYEHLTDDSHKEGRQKGQQEAHQENRQKDSQESSLNDNAHDKANDNNNDNTNETKVTEDLKENDLP